MNTIKSAIIFTLIGVSVIFLHEATHLTIAYLVGQPTFGVQSWLPLRVSINFDDQTSWKSGIRLMAIAPTVIGFLFASFFLLIDDWTVLSNTPYYFRTLCLLYWLLYTLPSLEDLQTFLTLSK